MQNQAEENENMEMMNLQISNSQEPEVAMSIEANPSAEDYTSIIFYLIIVFVTALSGYLAQQNDITGRIDYKFHGNRKNLLHKTFSPLSDKNLLIRINIAFIPEPVNKTTDRVIQLSSIYAEYLKNIKKHTYMKPLGAHFEIKPNDNVTQEITLFFTRIKNIDQIEIYIHFENIAGFKSAVFTWSYVNEQVTRYQFYTRLSFFIMLIICLSIYLLRLRQIDMKRWRLEQKFAILMLVAATFSSFPGYLYFMLSKFEYSFAALFITHYVYDSIIYSFIVAGIDILRVKDIGKLKKWLTFNYVFFTIRFIALFILFCLSLFYGNSGLIFLGQQFLHIIPKIWILVDLILAYSKSDPTERHRFNIYSILFGLIIGISFVSTLFNGPSVLSITTVGFAITFASTNSFTILVAFYHWPYVSSVDIEYSKPEDINKNEECFDAEPDPEQSNDNNNNNHAGKSVQ